MGYNPIGLKSEIEAIDAEITRAALQAERSTAAKSFGYAWSPTLAKAGQQVTFWRDCFRAAKHNQDPFLHLTPSQLNQHNIKHAGLSHAFYSSRLQDAWTNLCTVQENSNQHRKTFLATTLSHAKRGGEKKRAVKLRAIQQAEYMKELWPKLRKYAKGEIRSGLDRVEVPVYDSDGEIVGWCSVTAPEELFNTLLTRNIKHFSQAKDTPFIKGALGQLLNPFEQNHFSYSILQGPVDISHLSLSASIQACIHAMQFPPGEDGSNPVDDSISPEDFAAGFKQLSEDLS